jgi:putative hydrolase of the HAD superfamily
MTFTTIFFDLDDTIYPSDSGLWQELSARMSLYIHERLNIAEDLIPDLRKRLFSTYGTTMRGLIAEFEIDRSEFLKFVHNVPLENFISPDPEVRRILQRLPQNKYIFTNADSHHASRVLKYLGLDDLFNGIIDILAIEPYSKPQPGAFRIALARADSKDPQSCIFLDDYPANLLTASEMGFFTIYVGSNNDDVKCDKKISNLIEIEQLLPHLLRGT